jgi:hypothetical protein
MRSAVVVSLCLLALVIPTAASANPVLVRVTSPVHPGSYASITVRSGSHVVCSIRVHLGSHAPIIAAGLSPKGGLFAGIVQWRWQMSTHATRGRWTIDISCGSFGSLRTTFLVT